MSVTITIKGTPIDFPSSGESPNWSPAVIEFAQAVEEALLSVVGPNDIPSQVFTILNDNVTVDVTNLSFSTADVRSVYIKYAIILSGSSVITEAGNIILVYNGSSWELTRDFVGDTTGCNFQISGIGQVSITIPVISGFTSGKLSFSAQALQQT